jgi:hypothetical protein
MMIHSTPVRMFRLIGLPQSALPIGWTMDAMLFTALHADNGHFVIIVLSSFKDRVVA